MGAAISFPHDCYILRNGRIRGLWMKEGRSKEQERTCNSQIRKDMFTRSHILFNRADHRATDNISWEEVEEYIVFRGFDRGGAQRGQGTIDETWEGRIMTRNTEFLPLLRDSIFPGYIVRRVI